MTLDELLRQAGLLDDPSGYMPPEPVPVMPRPSLPEMQPVEAPPMQMPQPSGGQRFAENFGMALAQNPLQYQSRGRGGVEDFLGNLLASAGNTYGGATARDVAERERFNERRRVAAADANKRNIEASRQAEQDKIARLQRVSDSARTLRERREEKRLEQQNELERIRVREEEQRITDARRPRIGGAASNMTPEDADAIADAIVRGDQPPTLAGLYRNAGPVRASLAKKGYDLTRAGLDYESARRHLASQNGTIQLRLRQAAENARGSVDVARELNAALSERVKRSNIEGLNKPILALIKNVGDAESAGLATQLQGQIAALQSELSNVYQGGGVPTDEARKMAQNIIRADMSPRNLEAALDLAMRDIGVRLSAVREVQAISPSNPTGMGGGGTYIGGRFVPIESPGVGQRVRVRAPDGRTGTIDAAELSQAEANGWVRIQ